MWSMGLKKIQKCHVVSEEFMLVVRKLVRSLEKEELEIWAVPSFWNARNAFIYDGQDANPAQFIFTSLSHSEILKLFRSIRNLNFELK
jgi:hypothetical protein